VFRNRKGLLIALVIALLVVANLFSPFKVTTIHIELAAEPIAHIGGWAITNTLLSSWVAGILLIIVALTVRRKLVDAPAALSLQNVVETILETLHNFMQNMVGPNARAFLPLVSTFFLFILITNWFSMLPGVGSLGIWRMEGEERVFVPLFRGATSDLNTTIALAACSVISIQVYGIRFRGFGKYMGHFVPLERVVAFIRALFKGQVKIGLLLGGILDMFIGLLEIFEEMTKILSFSFRLFGNIFGGEVLLLVMAYLAPFVISIPFMILELFAGFIQAFIFATLTTAFLGRAAASHDHVPAAEEEAHPVPAPSPQTALPSSSKGV
jgi:F-type H+-transporting ATPase subunit a